jgi:hypothetical protein
MDPEVPTHGRIDVTDVLALVLIVLASLRRLDVKVAERGDHLHVPGPAFDAWKVAMLRGYGLVIQASFLKIVLNLAWYYGAGGRVPYGALAVGGAALFIAWVVALVVAWRRVSNGRVRQAQLGIVLRGRRGDGDPRPGG